MHYAGIVSSSFLSARPTAGQSSTAKSAVRVVVRSITMEAVKMHHDSGDCCCRKGKCKELPGLSPYGNRGHFNRGTFRMYEGTSGNRTMIFQPHGNLRRVRRVFANMFTHSNVFRTSPCFTMFSRSVASAASIPKRQTATFSSRPPGAQSTRISNFRDKNFPHSQCNLQELWEAFSALRNEEEMGLLDARELLSFGGMIMRAERDSDATEVMSNSVEWGHRLEHVVLELKKRSPFRSPAEALQLDCLAIVAQALRGHCDDAAAALASLLRSKASAAEHSLWILCACRHVLLSFLRHASPSQAVDFYLDNYKPLRHLLMKGPTGVQSLTRIGGPLFSELSAVFRAMVSPASFLATRKDMWVKSRVSSLGRTMLHVLCQDGLAEDALEVYEELKRQNISVLFYLEHPLVRALTKAQRYERANLLYVAIAPKSSDGAEVRSYDSAGLHLFAHQGDVERAEECFKRLSARGGVLPQELTLVMHASATKGDTKRTVELFDQFFGKPDQKSRKSTLRKPNLYHYSAMIHAHSVRDDFDGINHWLERMLADGYTPDIATYNILLKGVAQRDDLKSVHSLLDQMRAARVPPNAFSYTTIITTLARRRDVLGAEAMFKRMIREGIALDRVAVTTLMNAHVEAGSWKGVIRVFDFLRGSQLKDLRLGIEVFNTLLKAYVLIGAPLDVVTDIFRRLEMSNIRPTNRTFALLIQSACASGRMDIASRLFVEMEALEKDWTTDVDVTKEVLTIIMAAYLRQGNKLQARVIYDDMQRRGIQPTAYTFASILRSYSNVAFEENIRIAQDFLDSLVSQSSQDRAWVQPASGRESSLAFVYAPLLNAHTKKLDVETVERVYSDFIDHNKRPTIGTLALLMDAYRRTGNIEGVRRTWPQIVELALDRTDEVDMLLHPSDTQSKFFRLRRRADTLCIPLSMYVDALSYAGQHIEIAHTWNKLRDAGFQFDSHNWNHLVVALVRAGQPVRAFEVVEKVILPYQVQSYSILRTRSDKVDSPLVFDDEETRAEMEDEPFIAKVERSSQKRASLLERVRRRFTGRKGKESDDLAHELDVLQQISPEWNVWRPHALTLQMLSGVLEQLDAGHLIHPTKPKLGEGDPEASDEDTEDETRSAEEAREARQVLNQILRDYPQTLSRIDKWERDAASFANKEKKHLVWQTRDELRETRQEGLG